MAPIHDTDVAEKRWSDEEWRQFELWEKIEVRLRRKRLIWVGLALLGFVVLSAIPTALERWPKWVSRRVSRQVAQEINRLRSQAILDSRAYRLTFGDSPGLTFQVESGDQCAGTSGNWQVVRTGAFLSSRVGRTIAPKFKILTPSEGEALGISVLKTQVCIEGVDIGWATSLSAGNALSESGPSNHKANSDSTQAVAVAGVTDIISRRNIQLYFPYLQVID